VSLNTEYNSHLHSQIIEVFNLDELSQLCFYLDVNDEELAGETLSAKSQSLLEYFDRRQRLDELLLEMEKQRPHVDWGAYHPDEFDADPPYKGLQYYTEADESIFYGRRALIADLLDHLGHHHFLAIVGASGSGKSSLIRAGIIPATRRGEVTFEDRSSQTWSVHIITPGDAPLKALAATLTRNTESVTSTATLIEDMKTNTQSLDLWLYRELSEPDARTLLIVDQFEELFTHCQDVNERQLFVENLVQAVQSGQQGKLTLIISLRADFYGHTLRYEGVRNLLETEQKLVGAMTYAELRMAIEEPALRQNWDFQPGLVDVILHDVNASAAQTLEPGALPLLSHALLETWRRRKGRTMTLAGYRAAGGVSGAITKTAEGVYQKLSPDKQTIAKNMFLRLVNLGESTEDTRRHARNEELLSLKGDEVDIQAVLTMLIDARLLTVDESGVEVTHEAIIREWPRLRDWLDEDREAIRLHRQLTEAAEIWQDYAYDTSSLLRGLRLTKMETWAAESEHQLNDLERSFLEASRDDVLAEERAKVADRQRIRKAGLFGMAGGAVGFALSFLLIYAAQIEDQSLLAVLTLLRILLGAVSGFLFIFAVDLLVSWYQGVRPWVPWLLGGLGGAFAFAFLLFFEGLLKTSGPGSAIFVTVAALEGAIWGSVAGVGRVWLLATKRPFWQTWPVIGAATGGVLLIIEQLTHTFADSSWISLLIVGALFPLSILAAAQLADSRLEGNNSIDLETTERIQKETT
jgi:energy-coupling factor transporter ATP-binding protein EcfA2